MTNVNTGSQADVINTGSGDDNINDTGGDNTIDAGGGRNNVNTGNGNDKITTGSGDDNINAGDGANTIDAGGGRNNVNTGNGNDVITTGSGDDTINAGEGANTIIAGDGRNNVNTGNGSDVIIAGSGDDTINAGGGDNIIDTGEGRNTVNTGSGNDVITAGDGDNTINAGDGNNIIDAGNGRNTVNTGSGIDTIISGNGNDTINSGAGDDTVMAGGGQNQVNLGSGNDTVIHNVGDGGFSRYNGDSGRDTLKIVLTEQLAQDAGVLGELTRLANAARCGTISYFKSDILKLELTSFEDVQILVPVAAHDDIATTTENGPVNIPVLANDVVLLGSADSLRVSDVALANGPAGVDPAALAAALSIDPNGKSVTFTPGNLFDHLAAGQTTTATFRYTVVNNQGFEDAAQVTITITGTNDGATISGSKAGAVIEDTASSTSGTLVVTDVDAGQDHFQTPASLAGTYGSFGFDATTGEWTYALDARAQKLTAGQVATETLTVTAQDGTATKTIMVNVTGTNDVATITGNAMAAVTEDTATSSSGMLVVTDADSGENHFQVDPAALNASRGTFTFDTATGAWTYTLDSRAEALIAGGTVLESLTVGSIDGTDTKQIVVMVVGTNDAATISGDRTGAVTEDSAPTTSGTLTVHDVDQDQNRFRVPYVFDGDYGKFSFSSELGDWTYTLDSRAQALAGGQVVTETLTVTSADGTASETITIDVTGTNDTPFIDALVSPVLTEEATAPVLLATVDDADAGESGFRMPASLSGAYGSFGFDAAGGLTYATDERAQALAEGETGNEIIYVTSIDGTETRQIVVAVKGQNDNAQIYGSPAGSVTEDSEPTTAGTLLVLDVDHDQNRFQTPATLVGRYGNFTFDAATGTWTYSLDARAQTLGADRTMVETVTVTSLDGTASSPIYVTVLGANDIPVVVANAATSYTALAGSLNTAAAFSLDLHSLITDVDATDSLQFTTSTLPAGFTLGADGIIRQTDAHSLNGTGIHSLHVTANDGHGGVVSKDVDLYVAESFGDNFSQQTATSVVRSADVSVLDFGFRAGFYGASLAVTTCSGGDWLHFGDYAGGAYSALNVNAGDGNNRIVFGDSAAYLQSSGSVTTGTGDDYISTGSRTAAGSGVFSASTGAGNDTIKIGGLSAEEGTVIINAGSGADDVTFADKAGTGNLDGFNPSRGGNVTVDLGVNDHAADVLNFDGAVKATVRNFEVGIDDLNLSTLALTLTESGNDVHLTSNGAHIDVWLMGVGTGHSVGDFLL